MNLNVIAGVDVGSDGVKGLFKLLGDTKITSYYIPNILDVSTEERSDVSLGQLSNVVNPLEKLHVKINSTALQPFRNNRAYIVGKLAEKVANPDEPFASKAENDQTIIMLLTTLAVFAAENSNRFPTYKVGEATRQINVDYALGTGLPLQDIKNKKDKDFRKRLLTGKHSVTFLNSTPRYAGITINISFSHLGIYPEGYSAIMDLRLDDDLKPINSELKNKVIMIQDIGGLSTDIAVIDGNEPNDTYTDGKNLGVIDLVEELEPIIRKVSNANVRNNRMIIEYLKSYNQQKQLEIYGNDFQNDEVLNIIRKHAEKQYSLMRKVWLRNPDISMCYFIGGGAVLFEKYIRAINQNTYNFKIRFADTPEKSVWMNANAYMKLITLNVKTAEKIKFKQSASHLISQ
jgi:plasmid segregation protein ParM